MSGLLVSPSWLDERLGSRGLKVVDGSWYLPAQNRDARTEFRQGHIPGAVFFDIDAISDRSTNLPHMLPYVDDFARAAGALGLSESDTIVVYDGAGLFSAPRVWWTLRVFGASDVRLLNGGLPAWTASGHPLEGGEATPEPARFTARLDRAAVADLERVRAALEHGTAAVADARPAPRFQGEAPEPRPGLPSGHIPGSRNLPFDRLVEAGHLAAPDDVRQLFKDAGLDLSGPVITSCGSGVTAAILLFALATLGKYDVSLYDGSWAEWASKPGMPIATGPL